MKEKEFVEKVRLKDDRVLLSYILDKYYQYKKSKMTTYSNFLNDRELVFLINSLSFLNIPYNVYKPNEFCERSIIYFGEYIGCVSFYKIEVSEVNHSDVLGSLFGCGMTHSMIGDIFVLDDVSYITNLEKYDFLLEVSLNKIGTKKVKLEKLERFPTIERKFKSIILFVNSTRVDLIISKLLKISRKNTLEYMNKKRVLLNYSKIEKITNLKEKDVLSIEGFGKIIIDEISNGKNNLKISIKKYC